MTVQYSVTVLGTLHLPSWMTKEEVQEAIKKDCYERDIDVEEVNDIEWEIV